MKTLDVAPLGPEIVRFLEEIAPGEPLALTASGRTIARVTKEEPTPIRYEAGQFRDQIRIVRSAGNVRHRRLESL